jgi:chromosomal replication initiation ATPase DnaA
MNIDQFNKWVSFVEKAFDLKQGDLLSKKRHRDIAKVRHICFHMMRNKGMVYTTIGKLFNRDHSTIIHGKEQAEDIIIPFQEINITTMDMVDEYLNFLIGRKK